MPRANIETATPVEIAWSAVTSALSKAKANPFGPEISRVQAALTAYGREKARAYVALLDTPADETPATKTGKK